MNFPIKLFVLFLDFQWTLQILWFLILKSFSISYFKFVLLILFNLINSSQTILVPSSFSLWINWFVKISSGYILLLTMFSLLHQICFIKLISYHKNFFRLSLLILQLHVYFPTCILFSLIVFQECFPQYHNYNSHFLFSIFYIENILWPFIRVNCCICVYQICT